MRSRPSPPRSGVVGLRLGRVVLQEFQAPGDPDHESLSQTLYRLQRDLSRYAPHTPSQGPSR